MMRLACVLVIPLAVMLVAACGGGTEEPPDQDSFADGLTAEEILERSSKANEAVDLFRIRESKTTEFLGIKRTTVTETAVAFESVHVITEDGDSRSEYAYVDGVGYRRGAEDGEWERVENTDVVASFRSELEDAVDATTTGDVPPVRLRDGEIEGRTMMRVQASGSTPIDLDASLQALCDDLNELGEGEVTCLPPALAPNEVEHDLIFWYGVDDFLLYRLEVSAIGRRDGEEFLKMEEVTEFFDYGEQIVMPNPLAD